MEQRKITFIGAGNMAQAIIAGLLRAGYPAPLICDTNRTAETRHARADRFGIQTSSDNLSAAAEADVIVL
ncbi:MAG: pyrroline-5-carboxylate reductase family protein, partial [Plesiomonas shigelloides]